MKKILLILLTLSLGLASCTNEVKDKFNDSASERVNQAVEKFDSYLRNAPNGWHFEYFPNATQSYGGFNMLMRFLPDSNTVEMTSEFSAGKIESSEWTINLSDGPVLAFDTYNSLIHYFADPEPGQGTSKGGDLEFQFQSQSTEDVIVLRGTRTGNILTMRRVNPNMSWDAYLAQYTSLRDEVRGLGIPSFSVEINGEDVTATDDGVYTILSFTTEETIYGNDEDGNPISYTSKEDQGTTAYIFTTTGIKFYDSINVLGVDLYEFTWDRATSSFISVENPSIVLRPNFWDLPMNIDECVGRWRMNFDPTDRVGATSFTFEITAVESDDPFAGASFMSSEFTYPFFSFPVNFNIIYFNKTVNGFEFPSQYMSLEEGEVQTEGGEVIRGRYLSYPAVFNGRGTDGYVNEELSGIGYSYGMKKISENPLVLEFTAMDEFPDANGINIIQYGDGYRVGLYCQLQNVTMTKLN